MLGRWVWQGVAEGQTDNWTGQWGSPLRTHSQGGVAFSGIPSGQHVPCCHIFVC